MTGQDEAKVEVNDLQGLVDGGERPVSLHHKKHPVPLGGEGKADCHSRSPSHFCNGNQAALRLLSGEKQTEDEEKKKDGLLRSHRKICKLAKRSLLS